MNLSNSNNRSSALLSSQSQTSTHLTETSLSSTRRRRAMTDEIINPSTSAPHRPITRSFSKLQTQQQKAPSFQSHTIFNESDRSKSNSKAEYMQMLSKTRLEQAKKQARLENEKMTYQKIIVDERPCNIIHILEKSRMTGQTIRNISNYPDRTLQLISQRINTHDYPVLIKRLEQLSFIANLRSETKEYQELVQVLKEIDNRLINYSPINGDTETSVDEEMRDEFDIETINLESVKAFRQYGGLVIFKRILIMSVLVCNTSATTDIETSRFVEKPFILKLKCKCIQILNRIICLPKIGKVLVPEFLNYKPDLTSKSPQIVTTSNYDSVFLQYLFSLLMFKECRLPACQLIESILLYIPILNLNQIANMKYILEHIDDDGLACICKIFAVTLSNLDSNDKKYLATNRRVGNSQQQHQQTTGADNNINPVLAEINDISSVSSPTIIVENQNNNSKSQLSPSSAASQALSIRDQNQEFLLSLPTFLSRLVNLVRSKDYTRRFSGLNCELEHWIRSIDEALSDSEENESVLNINDNELPDRNVNTARGTNYNLNANTNVNTGGLGLAASMANVRNFLENQYQQPALLASSRLNNFVYVLYTISLLLIGKEKKKVQKSLTKLRFASVLNSLFDHLIWKCNCEFPNSQNNGSVQQRTHICPEVAVKIQFLRLVHSFCDHSDFKRTMLSREESEEIQKYNKDTHPCLQVSECIFGVESRYRCTRDSKGLLSKIVLVIRQEPFTASFRFWLIRAIESFLRGGTSYADQLFLINRGVVEDTTQNILAINFTRPKEVIQSCFDMLGELIKFNARGFTILDNELNETEKFNLLLTMIMQNLVDSNMFLRSIFLSINFFERNFSALNYKISSNKVLSYFNVFDRQIAFLCRMMNIVTINNLSQENISCLNTTLIVLMLANKKSQLPKYLRAIKVKSVEMSLASEIMNVNNTSQTETQNSNTLSMPASNSSSSTSSSITSPLRNGDIMSNFKDLLQFWQSHYLQKDKDCVGLELNSRIDFSYWKSTVELLLDTNALNSCSLNFYLQTSSSLSKNSCKNKIGECRYE